MLPAALDSLMPAPAPAARKGEAGAAGLSNGAPDNGAASAIGAFAALLQSGLADARLEPQTTADSSVGTLPMLSGVLDALPEMLPELPPDGNILPAGHPVTAPMAAAVTAAMGRLPAVGDGQILTESVNNDPAALSLDELLDDMPLDQKLTAGRETLRLEAEFARLAAVARMNAGDTVAVAAEAEPTMLNALQGASGEGRNAEQPAASRPLSLNTPLQHPDWNNEFANRITWLANSRVQSAEIRLNPQHLGPIDIQIRMEGDQANLVFGAAHAQVRDAIEAALPRLREMFAAQGLDIASVSVDVRDDNAQRFAGGDAGQGNGQGSGNAGTGDDAGGMDGMAAGVTTTQAAAGLVDIFA